MQNISQKGDSRILASLSVLWFRKVMVVWPRQGLYFSRAWYWNKCYRDHHLPTTYRPLTDHIPTTYRPLTDHLPTTYRPLFYGAACSRLPCTSIVVIKESLTFKMLHLGMKGPSLPLVFTCHNICAWQQWPDSCTEWIIDIVDHR